MFGKKNGKPKSKTRKIIEWVLTGIFAAAIVGVGVLQIINRTSKNQSVFGAQFQKVLTDSMSPTYKVNDIIFIETKVDPADLKARVDAGKNVDVSFKWMVEGQEVSMTHRLQSAEFYVEPQRDPITGEVYQYTFVAHGINKTSEWCKGASGYQDCTTQTQVFHEGSIIGRVVRKSYFMTFATSIWGLLVLLLVPCMYLIISSVFDICRALDDKEEVPVDGQIVGEAGEKKDPLAGLSEKEKQKLKEQMLKEMLEGKKKE